MRVHLSTFYVIHSFLVCIHYKYSTDFITNLCYLHALNVCFISFHFVSFVNTLAFLVIGLGDDYLVYTHMYMFIYNIHTEYIIRCQLFESENIL